MDAHLVFVVPAVEGCGRLGQNAVLRVDVAVIAGVVERRTVLGQRRACATAGLELLADNAQAAAVRIAKDATRKPALRVGRNAHPALGARLVASAKVRAGAAATVVTAVGGAARDALVGGNAGEARRRGRRPARAALPNLAGRTRIELGPRDIHLALVVLGAAAHELLAVQRRAAVLDLAVRAGLLGAGAGLAARAGGFSDRLLGRAVVGGEGVAGASGEHQGSQGRESPKQSLLHDSSSPLVGFLCPVGESARVYSRGSSIVTDRFSTILAASFFASGPPGPERERTGAVRQVICYKGGSITNLRQTTSVLKKIF